jgi:hypothetical protein
MRRFLKRLGFGLFTLNSIPHNGGDGIDELPRQIVSTFVRFKRGEAVASCWIKGPVRLGNAGTGVALIRLWRRTAESGAELR